MKVVAFVPIRLNSTRLKNKNLLELAGRPLCWHIVNTLLQVSGIDEVFVYCSDERIQQYIPQEAKFLKRDKCLDGDFVKGADIYNAFVRTVEADVYVLAHATSPFVEAVTIKTALDKVLLGENDSAFSVKKVQNFAWYEGKTLNYQLEDVPRTQDLEPVWIETSAFFIFKKDLFLNYGRRIGFCPYRQEVKGKEALDIDCKEDFELAEAYSLLISKNCKDTM